MDDDLLWRGFSIQPDSDSDSDEEIESGVNMRSYSFSESDDEAERSVVVIDETPRYECSSCSESEDEEDKDDDHVEFRNVGDDDEDESGTAGFVPWSHDEPTFRLDQGKTKRPKWTTSGARLSIIDELKNASSPVHEKEKDEWEEYFYKVSAYLDIFDVHQFYSADLTRTLTFLQKYAAQWTARQSVDTGKQS